MTYTFRKKCTDSTRYKNSKIYSRGKYKYYNKDSCTPGKRSGSRIKSVYTTLRGTTKIYFYYSSEMFKR